MIEEVDWSEFEVYQGQRAKRPPMVTLTPDLRLILNAAAVESLGTPPRVKVLFSPSKRTAILQPAGETDHSAFALSLVANGKLRLITVRLLCRHYGIPRPTKSRKITAEAKSGVLIIPFA